MLDDLDEFAAALVTNAARVTPGNRFPAGDIYCPRCGGPRRVYVRVLRLPWGQLQSLNLLDTSTDAIVSQIVPALFEFECFQCNTTFTVLVFSAAEAYELVVFPNVHGGLSTPHTPQPVAFYLDQAQRAENAGAKSGAVAMYRAALEHLLYQQGFTDRMLGPKIAALERAIDDGSAPKWARDLNPAFLRVIKNLGDAAIHPGEGDITRQATLDRNLLRRLKVTFAEILKLAFEREHEERARLEELEAAVSTFEERSGRTPRQETP